MARRVQISLHEQKKARTCAGLLLFVQPSRLIVGRLIRAEKPGHSVLGANKIHCDQLAAAFAGPHLNSPNLKINRRGVIAGMPLPVLPPVCPLIPTHRIGSHPPHFALMLKAQRHTRRGRLHQHLIHPTSLERHPPTIGAVTWVLAATLQ